MTPELRNLLEAMVFGAMAGLLLFGCLLLALGEMPA